jgi:hypothetical protein
MNKYLEMFSNIWNSTPVKEVPINTVNPYQPVVMNLPYEEPNTTPYEGSVAVKTDNPYWNEFANKKKDSVIQALFKNIDSKDPVKDPIEYIMSKEGKNNSYTTKNMDGSSAYGKYQFMPTTGKYYAKKIGIDPNKWKEPENQEKIMRYALKDYTRLLNTIDIPNRPENLYTVHQLGPSRAKRYFTGKLTDKDLAVMRKNLPKRMRKTKDVVGDWSYLYNKPNY